MQLSLSEVPDMGSGTARVQIRQTQPTIVVKTASYVRGYLAKTMAHFKECNIHFSVVVRELVASLIRYAPGDPYTKLPDEGDINAGLSCISPAADQLKLRVEAYCKALDRLHANRISRLA